MSPSKYLLLYLTAFAKANSRKCKLISTAVFVFERTKLKRQPIRIENRNH